MKGRLKRPFKRLGRGVRMLGLFAAFHAGQFCFLLNNCCAISGCSQKQRGFAVLSGILANPQKP
ncbi:hypothetical protein E4T99_01140 [Neisseria sp. WF04]|nr:hypothetical protein E4T99_01140 [Neisseria sp. WF04]